MCGFCKVLGWTVCQIDTGNFNKENEIKIKENKMKFEIYNENDKDEQEYYVKLEMIDNNVNIRISKKGKYNFITVAYFDSNTCELVINDRISIQLKSMGIPVDEKTGSIKYTVK